MKCIIASLLVLSVFVLVTPSAFAENVPEWVKNTAGWWADDKISEEEFVNAIEFLVKENIMQVNVSQTSETTQSVPEWVKNTAGWWSTDAISETEFVNAIAYMVKVGIISIESSKSPELIAETWVNGHINDDEFLTSIEYLIETENIIIPDNSITKTSQLPDWLVNNAGWWAARIFTNSDFDFDPSYINEKIQSDQHGLRNGACPEGTYNSYGFRGEEFEKEKPDDTYRILAVGGSTTFGLGAPHCETWPAYLQQIINEKITGKKIEVINAGIEGAKTDDEYNLIKNKLTFFEPDLIIMYDGINDFTGVPVRHTTQNWESVCKLGKNEGFDTIIIVQPITITGKRVLTEQEIWHSIGNISYLQISQQYVDAFEKLDEVCLKTIDFRGIFDYIQEPIFWDGGHTTGIGNKIIAENVFSVISSYFGKTLPVIHSLHAEKSESIIGVVYAVGSDLSGRNFDNLNLQNAVFDKADLSNTSFKNANINGARFVFANLNNSNLLDRTDLSNINLAGTDLSNLSLKGKNLSGTILIGIDLSGKDLTGTILTGADLSNSDLTGVDLSGKDLTETILTGADLSNANLTGADLSGVDITETILIGADLSNANLTGVDLSDKNLTSAKLVSVDLSGKDLTGTLLKNASLADANLENANLYRANFIDVDLTNIKNKSLARANMTHTSFAYSNLSGVNLSEVILFRGNWNGANLSGQDFTLVSNASIPGAIFMKSNLSNSNFEGVDLSPKVLYYGTLENKAHLNNLQRDLLLQELFDDVHSVNKRIIHVAVNGNDLKVNWVFANSFILTNLENANFKNADLTFADFRLANLTNADLEGANLEGANLEGANLEGANLDGANLKGANLDGANLDGRFFSCKGIDHPMCLNE